MRFTIDKLARQARADRFPPNTGCRRDRSARHTSPNTTLTRCMHSFGMPLYGYIVISTERFLNLPTVLKSTDANGKYRIR